MSPRLHHGLTSRMSINLQWKSTEIIAVMWQ